MYMLWEDIKIVASVLYTMATGKASLVNYSFLLMAGVTVVAAVYAARLLWKHLNPLKCRKCGSYREHSHTFTLVMDGGKRIRAENVVFRECLHEFNLRTRSPDELRCTETEPVSRSPSCGKSGRWWNVQEGKIKPLTVDKIRWFNSTVDGKTWHQDNVELTNADSSEINMHKNC